MGSKTFDMTSGGLGEIFEDDFADTCESGISGIAHESPECGFVTIKFI